MFFISCTAIDNRVDMDYYMVHSMVKIKIPVMNVLTK